MQQTDSKNLMTFMIAGGLAMALLVYISNKLVGTPITWLNSNWFTYGQFTFPLTFLITDIFNRIFGAQKAYIVIAAGFIVGCFFSIALNDYRIGIASSSAFVIGQYLDVRIFNRLKNAIWWQAPLISSVIASLIDTTWFYTIAFAGRNYFAEFGGVWWQYGIVDFGVKMLVAVAALVPFRILIAYAFERRQQV